MDKIQIIEKLFSYLLSYSFLLLPLFFLIKKSKRNTLSACLAVYGLTFFFMNEFYYDLPFNLRKVQQFVYTLLEYSTFTYIIWANVENRRFKKIILYLSFIFLSALIFFYFNVKLGKIDSVPVGIETILIFLYCFFYFYWHLNENQGKNIYNDRNFILIIGILFYLGSSFFFNILANNLSKEQLEKYWHWTWIPEIFKNILFAIGILKYSAKSKVNTTLKSFDIPYLDMI